jgi:hypothetical protein
MLLNDQDQLLLDALARPHSHLTSSSYALLSYLRCRLHTSVSRDEMILDALVDFMPLATDRRRACYARSASGKAMQGVARAPLSLDPFVDARCSADVFARGGHERASHGSIGKRFSDGQIFILFL